MATAPDDTFVVRLRLARRFRNSAEPDPKSDLPLIEGKPPAATRDSEVVYYEFPDVLLNLKQYRPIRPLGQGGMGAVFLAQDLNSKRLEALKILPQTLASPAATQRFRSEIMVAARLDHPNIVRAFSVLPVKDCLVFAMEYVDGVNLKVVLERDGPLPAIKAATYGQQVAQGLEHSYRRGVVHRDIKPSNLMLTQCDGKDLIKIMDFGLAKANSELPHSGSLTGLSEIFGTPDYIAPEQTESAKNSCIQADIYSLGCTMYFLLTGRPPFAREHH